MEGADYFRARVDSVPQPMQNRYKTKTVVAGHASDLQHIAVGDLFKARVTVAGALPYRTQFGGGAALPVLMIDSIEIPQAPDRKSTS